MAITEVIEHPSTERAPPGLAARIGVILASHVTIDTYAAIVPAILGLLEVRCHLQPYQTAWLLGIGTFSSGVSQPICAWLSDRFDTRLFGALGLAIGAVCLCLIGTADSYASLLPLFVAGTFGVGMFHPIAASSMGQLNYRKRSAGVSMFFVAGMGGGMLGAFLVPRLASLPRGLDMLLPWLMIPGLVLAAGLHASIGSLPHRAAGHHQLRFAPRELGARWGMLACLYVAAALKFTVNMALFYLYVRWTQGRVHDTNPGWSPDQIAVHAAPFVGNLIALTMLGMACGGLIAGYLVRHGTEKWPMVLVPIVFAPVIVCFPYASLTTVYLLCILTGIGFASMIPVSVAVGQRLLPHRTSLASSLLMGGAWSVATLGPRLAEFGVDRLGLPITFACTAMALALSGLAAIPVRPSLLSRSD